MKLNLGKILLLPGVLTISMMMQAPVMAEYEHGPTRRGGCYVIGDERVKFVSQIVYTNSDSDLKQLQVRCLLDVIRQMYGTISGITGLCLIIVTNTYY